MNVEETENVKVIRGEPGQALVPRQRSKAQQRRDDILDDAEAQLRGSRDLLVEAMEGIELLMLPQHRNIDTLIGQLIEQVIEFRRTKG